MTPVAHAETPFGAHLAWRAHPVDQPNTTHAPDRQAIAHELLAGLLHDLRPGIAPEAFVFVRRCPSCGSTAHGAPSVRLVGEHSSPSPALPRIGISYAAGLVAVGVAPPEATAFAIDVELDDDLTRARIAEALDLHPSDADTRTWTRLEAIAKASGAGLGTSLRAPAVETRADGTWHTTTEPPLLGADLPLTLLAPMPRAILTVALALPEPRRTETARLP
ncbi:4'-phosphopantetheinyl transferase superfamily protein [Leucobacter japonicus]|uniref:4'-phosphopantetheinyl transferase superfamily protein n=1 Tax=Leucobacter japonicus TaxID=1461259 RepID=UPI0006A78B96|nr:4'-phosphopantetheinyl transferase superfamily protein [Leucobacter japonicus]